VKAAIAAHQRISASRRRLAAISGTQSPHLRLERALAGWKGTEAAACFSSGYAAALGSIPGAWSRKMNVVLLDKLLTMPH